MSEEQKTLCPAFALKTVHKDGPAPGAPTGLKTDDDASIAADFARLLSMKTERKSAPTPSAPAKGEAADTVTDDEASLASEFAALILALEPLRGPAPEDEDDHHWRSKTFRSIRPRLEKLIKMADTHPHAPEPLQSAFLLYRYTAIVNAAKVSSLEEGDSLALPGYFTPKCKEADLVDHLTKYGERPGVAAAAVAYAKWRGTMAGLGASALEILAKDAQRYDGRAHCE
ncbi:MAG TPA: hypothetical protein VNI01_15860 [Elusimicrobiota bacterium]|jgi:hypothetical protein|nr:hypothetical protein [Elusimicrobiota bacterium]